MRSSVFLALLLLAGCEHPAKTDEKPAADTPTPTPTPAPANGPKVVITTPSGDITVNVEVVSTEAKIERGLMYRQAMALDAGMLFLLPEVKDWTFWMRNTLIPLDMIFIARDMTIAGIVENAEPRTETMRQVERPSLYVLEVNGGFSAAHKIAQGAKVQFDGVPR